MLLNLSNYLYAYTFNRDEKNSPGFWSRVCLRNMAKLAKEATTVRRVLESLFYYFDNYGSWPAQNGLARYVLCDMQLLMEKDGKKFLVYNFLCLLYLYYS